MAASSAPFICHDGMKYMPVPLGSLRIDHGYQRALSNVAIQNNGAEGVFDRRAMRPLTVSLRKDGLYWIIDGQHRFNLAKIKKYQSLMCQIHEGLSPAEEAKLFVVLNNMKTVQAGAKFRADYKAGNPLAVQIVQMVKEHGFNICMSAGAPTTNNNIRSVGALLRIASIYKPDRIGEVLRIVKGAFTIGEAGEVHGVAYSDMFLSGFARYLETYPDSDIDDTIAALLGIGAEQFSRHVSESFPGLSRKDLAKGFAEVVDLRVQNYRRKLLGRRKPATKRK